MEVDEANERANRLDALLSEHVSPSADDEMLMPLLRTAAAFRQSGNIYPRSEFVRDLWGKLERQDAAMAIRRRLLRASAIAAAILLLVGVGFTLTAAVSQAGPGSPLYGLRKWEQGVAIGFTFDQRSRAQQRIGYAQDSLAALETVIKQNDYTTYPAALSSFWDNFAAAQSEVSKVSAGSERDALNAQIESLRTRATGDLYGALTGMRWSERLATTKVLGKLGNSVPHIQRVTYAHAADVPLAGTLGSTPGNSDDLLIQIHGEGFVAGAVVYINGRPVSDVRRVSRNDIQVVLHGVTTLAPGTIVGVTNPDGTADEFRSVSRGNASSQGIPTATPNSHGDHNGDSGTGTGTGSHG